MAFVKGSLGDNQKVKEYTDGLEGRIDGAFSDVGLGIVDYDFTWEAGFVKFANGFQLAWTRRDGDTGGGNLWDTQTKIWYSNHDMGNWKSPFTSLITTWSAVQNVVYWATGANANATSAGTVRLYRPNNGTEKVSISKIAIGRWK